MDDLISRQAAIEAVSRGCQEFRGIFAECEKNLNELSTAEKKGKWVEEDDDIIHGYCSSCGWMSVWQETDVFGMNYCPNCGAKMKGESDE